MRNTDIEIWCKTKFVKTHDRAGVWRYVAIKRVRSTKAIEVVFETKVKVDSNLFKEIVCQSDKTNFNYDLNIVQFSQFFQQGLNLVLGFLWSRNNDAQVLSVRADRR